MQADLEPEATPLRRLIAFGAVFLGMLTLANAAFARQPALLSPPAVLLIVLLAGTGGLLIWVNGRWSRAAFWAAGGVSAFVGGATGTTLLVEPGLAGAASVGLGAVTVLATWVVAFALLRPGPHLDRPSRWAQIAFGVALAGLWWIWFPVGGGPVIALTASIYAVLLALLLRPLPEDEGPEAEPTGPQDDREEAP